MKTFAFASALLAAVASAAPAAVEKRQSTDIDTTILNFALTLEHLESTFYKEGLNLLKAADFAKAGFTDPNFYIDLKKVARDEASHVKTLIAALKAAGAAHVEPCTYDFGFTDAASFVALASVLEGVGTSAYLGAAASITNKAYLTVAGSILTVEARHNAFFRTEQNLSPFAQAYDTPLDADQVYTLAAGFIKSCPKANPVLPVKAFPNLSTSGRFHKGDNIAFMVTPQLDSTLPYGDLYLAWPSVAGPIYTAARFDGKQVYSTVPVGSPTGPAGQAYAILVQGNSSLTDANTLAGPAIVSVYI